MQQHIANDTQKLLVPLLSRLKMAAGKYQGSGVNHAGEAFEGSFEMTASLSDALIEIRFRASDADNAFHEERTWITEDLINGGIKLWTVSTNTPGILELKLSEDADDGSYSTRAVFRLGDPEDRSRFREEISLNLRHDGGIEYVYSWGVPHEPFGVKSKVLLKPVS